MGLDAARMDQILFVFLGWNWFDLFSHSFVWIEVKTILLSFNQPQFLAMASIPFSFAELVTV